MNFQNSVALISTEKKTEGMWLGRAKYSKETVEQIRWNVGSSVIKILGVYFSNTTRASNIAENWNSRIEKILRIIKLWEKRNLSLLGKVNIIKTLLLSQFVYIMQALTIPEDILKSINTILSKCLWKKIITNKKVFE